MVVNSIFHRMKVKIFLIIIFAIVELSISAQPLTVRVAPYYQGRKAALSLTFDDGLQEHYTLLRQELNSRGLRATFAIIGSKVGSMMRSSQDKAMGISGTPCMTWQMIQQLAADGHEIGSHGWEHKNVTKLPAEQLRYEVQHNDSIIMMHTGRFPMSYFYPGNQKDSVTIAFCERNRVGSRTFQTSIGSKRDTLWLRQWVDGLVEKRKWGIGMTHGITTGYDHFTDPQILWSFLDYVVACQNNLWVAPFSEVAAYICERDNIELRVNQKDDHVEICPVSTLCPNTYHQPLTLIITGSSVRLAKQNGHKLHVYQKNGLQMVDFQPTDGTILLKVAASPTERPTMGWSSWNTYRVDISDSLIIRQADAMEAMGLKKVGYKYVNIDDGYFGGRDQQTGHLLIHPTRFPHGLRPVVEHIHKLGLKAGIYSDAGRNTCGSIYDADTIGVGVGLYGHDQQDCNYFFRELGFDFIKVDYCGGRPHPKGDTLSLDEQQRYTEIAEAIRHTGRKDVRLNICRWNFPGTWAAKVASSWRMSQDIRPRWSSVKDIIEQNLYLSAYCRDGHYNDMDMLEVGRGMSEEEDHTHFAVWCMMSSPLLIGCDLTKIKPETLRLLTDKQLIAINQDPLHLQAYVAKRQGDCYVLVKDMKRLHGKERAVALVNLSDKEQTMTIDYRILDLEGGSRTITLPAHATRVFIAKGRRLQRRLYEAETAFLTDYHELNNNRAYMTAIYEQDSLCSGGVKASWLGGRATNDLIWHDVYVEKDGYYALHIAALTDEPRTLHVDVNGRTVGSLSYDTNGQQTVVAELKKGRNTVRVHNDHERMPDVDYMSVETK